MRHFTRDRSPFRVRLACVKHAASVQSEPESNSPVQICSKDLRWTEIRISKFLPVRYSLVNEPHRFTRREAVIYAASFSLSTSFFISRKFFFAAPSGQLVGARETYVSFSNPRQELFCHPGKFLFPSPFRTWPARWRERLYAPFRSHRQAFFRKKIEKMFSDRQKGASASCSSVFQPAVCDSTASPRKSKALHDIFYTIRLQSDKPNKNIMIRHKSQSSANSRSPVVKSRRVRKEPLPTIRDARPQP